MPEMVLAGQLLMNFIEPFKHSSKKFSIGPKTVFTAENTDSKAINIVPTYIIIVTNGTATMPLTAKYTGN
jgi:hypothetical protein